MTLVIAQITDIHLGASTAQAEPNADRLVAVLSEVAGHRPDAIFLTGDLTQHGDQADYDRLRDLLVAVACPIHLLVGNHDRRDSLLSVFPETPVADGYVQSAVDLPGLRCIALDTLTDGRQGGGFCAKRSAWLGERLAETSQPTLIFAHHPPVATGIRWIDPDPNAAWIGQLADCLHGQEHVIGLAAGHVHAPSMTNWGGIPVCVAPPVAPALAASFAPIDSETADGRAMIVDSAPGYALHRWDGRQLTTHFVTARQRVTAYYDRTWQPLLRDMQAERRDGR